MTSALEQKMKNKILGKDFFLSIAYIDDKNMKVLNKKYRGKNETTDILSFRLEDKTGEILISKKKSALKAKQFGVKVSDYLPYLLIHGLLHLKGLTHSAIMDKQEKKYCNLFSIKYPFDEIKNNSRNRHRHAPDQSCRSRGSSRV